MKKRNLNSWLMSLPRSMQELLYEVIGILRDPDTTPEEREAALDRLDRYGLLDLFMEMEKEGWVEE